MSKMKEYIYEKEKRDNEELDEKLGEEVCYVCNGTGMMINRVLDHDTKEIVDDGEKKCICQVEEDFDDQG